MEPIRVAVVGGSLGGLTAGCLLRDAGAAVTIYERSSRELEQRGAGIGLLAATSRYLVERAGLALDDVSIETGHIRYLHRDGSVLHDAEHHYRFSSWNTVYRRLLDHWCPPEAGEGQAGAGAYRLGHEMVGFDQSDQQVTVHFADREAVTCDLLVCADGVGSSSRAMLQPDAAQAFAGYVAWRGMVPEKDMPQELAGALSDAITYYVYANSHILVYPIPGIDGSVAPGERLINFVWYRNYLEGGELDDVLTDRLGTRRELSLPPGSVAPHHDAEVRATAAARLPSSIAEVIDRTDELFLQVVYDIEVQRMAFGRVCLLGDAAFSVRPHAAAGTAKAADDGWALAAALEGAADVPAALRAWEPKRLALGAALLERTRQVGRRSQIDNTWVPGDPQFIFGLHRPGD